MKFKKLILSICAPVAAFIPLATISACNLDQKKQEVKVTAITITCPDSVAIDSTISLSATVTPDNATNKEVEWSVVDKTGKATILEGNKLKGTQLGTVTLTATAKDGSGVSKSKDITVRNPILVTGIEVTSAKDIIYTGESLQMTTNITPSDADNKKVTWEVTNGTGTASISPNVGLLIGGNAGTVTVTATATDGSGITGSKVITVSDAKVESITVTAPKPHIELNETLQCTATVNPSATPFKDVKWTVDDESVATIDSNGLLTAKTNGVVNVIATSTDGYSITGSLKIYVGVTKVEKITLTGLDSTVVLGQSYKVNATVEPSFATNQELEWKVETRFGEDGQLFYDQSGHITFGNISDTKAIIQVKAKDGSGVSVTKTVDVNKSIQAQNIDISVEFDDVYTYDTVQLKANVTPANARYSEIVWSFKDTVPSTTATIDAEKGRVTTKGVEDSITVVATEPISGTTAEKTLTIKNPEIKASDFSVPSQMSINSTMPIKCSLPESMIRKIGYIVSDSNKLSRINQRAIISGNTAESLVIYPTWNSRTALSSIPLNVDVVDTLSITGVTIDDVDHNPAINESLTMKCTPTPLGVEPLSVQWSVDDTNIATIDQDKGILIPKKSGTVTVTVTVNNSIVGTKQVTIENQEFTQTASEYIDDRTFSIEGVVQISPKLTPTQTGTTYSFGTGWILEDATPNNPDDYVYYVATNMHVTKGITNLFAKFATEYIYRTKLIRFGTAESSYDLNKSSDYISFANLETDTTALDWGEIQASDRIDQSKFMLDGSSTISTTEGGVTKTGYKGIDLQVFKADFSSINQSILANNSTTIKTKAKLNRLNGLTKQNKPINKFATTASSTNNYADNVPLYTGGYPAKANGPRWETHSLKDENIGFKYYTPEEHPHWTDSISSGTGDGLVIDCSPQYGGITNVGDEFMTSGSSGSMLLGDFGTAQAHDWQVCGIYWGGAGWSSYTSFFPFYSIFNSTWKNFLNFKN